MRKTEQPQPLQLRTAHLAESVTRQEFISRFTLAFPECESDVKMLAIAYAVTRESEEN